MGYFKMARYTKAYSNFIKRIAEVEALKRLAKVYSRINQPKDNAEIVNVLYRGSVVLLSSHIEGYIEELGELTLERIVTKKLRKK